MKVTLCGSFTYQKEFEEWEAKLSRDGHLVYSFGMLQEGDDFHAEEVLELVRQRKIMDSDAIIVVGSIDGEEPYVGGSVQREITWALMLGKKVYHVAIGRPVLWASPETSVPNLEDIT